MTLKQWHAEMKKIVPKNVRFVCEVEVTDEGSDPRIEYRTYIPKSVSGRNYGWGEDFATPEETIEEARLQLSKKTEPADIELTTIQAMNV